MGAVPKVLSSHTPENTPIRRQVAMYHPSPTKRKAINTRGDMAIPSEFNFAKYITYQISDQHFVTLGVNVLMAHDEEMVCSQI